MSVRQIKANEATAAKRRVYFDLRDATDGITPETGEADGQPQISTDGAAWTDTGIGTLAAIGNGRYYAELAQAAVATAGAWIETRFKSANTVESRGTSVQVVAANDVDLKLARAALANKKGKTIASGVLVIYDDDGATPLKTLTPAEASGVLTITPS